MPTIPLWVEIKQRGGAAVARELAGVEKAASGAESGITRIGTASKSSLAQAAGLAASLGFSLSAVAGAARSIKIGADFGQSMSNVRAVTQATGADFAKLKSLAEELGATTRFTASEAASGMEFLARAGFKTNEILEAMPDTLNLAAASGVDLGRAADVVTNILSAFGGETDELTRYVDVLARITANANTDLNQLAEGMKYAGPVAKAFGLDVEDAAAAVGVMSNAGIQASMAGTGLRQILLSLANPVGDASRALKEYGITAEEIDVVTRGLGPVLQTLSERITEADGAMRIAGDRGGPALEVLLESFRAAGEEGVSGFEKLGIAARETTLTAEGMADTMDDNLLGSWREMASAVESVAIKLSEGATPGLREAASAMTEAARNSGELAQVVGQGLGVAILAAANNLDTIIAGFAVLAAVNLAPLLASLNPVVLAVAAIAASVAVVNDAIKDWGASSAAEIERLVTLTPQLAQIWRSTSDAIASGSLAEVEGRLVDLRGEIERNATATADARKAWMDAEAALADLRKRARDGEVIPIQEFHKGIKAVEDAKAAYAELGAEGRQLKRQQNELEGATRDLNEAADENEKKLRDAARAQGVAARAAETAADRMRRLKTRYSEVAAEIDKINELLTEKAIVEAGAEMQPILQAAADLGYNILDGLNEQEESIARLKLRIDSMRDAYKQAADEADRIQEALNEEGYGGRIKIEVPDLYASAIAAARSGTGANKDIKRFGDEVKESSAEAAAYANQVMGDALMNVAQTFGQAMVDSMNGAAVDMEQVMTDMLAQVGAAAGAAIAGPWGAIIGGLLGGALGGSMFGGGGPITNGSVSFDAGSVLGNTGAHSGTIGGFNGYGSEEQLEEMVAALRAFESAMDELERITGATVERMPQIEINTTTTGEIIARVGGSIATAVKKTFESMEAAQSWALKTALRMADISNLTDDARAVINNAPTIDEAFELLDALRSFGEETLQPTTVQVRDLEAEMGRLATRLLEVGASATGAADSTIRELEAIRRQITGEELDEYKGRLRGAQEYNDELARIRAEAEKELAEIIRKLALLNGAAANNTDGIGEFGDAVDLLGRQMRRGARDLTGDIDELARRAEYLERLIGGLPDAIKPEDVKPKGRGSGYNRKQELEDLGDEMTAIFESTLPRGVAEFRELNRWLEETVARAQKAGYSVDEVMEAFQVRLDQLRQSVQGEVDSMLPRTMSDDIEALRERIAAIATIIKETGIEVEGASQLWDAGVGQIAQSLRNRLAEFGANPFHDLFMGAASLREALVDLRQNFEELGLTAEDVARWEREIAEAQVSGILDRMSRYIEDDALRNQLDDAKWQLELARYQAEIYLLEQQGILTEEQIALLHEALGELQALPDNPLRRDPSPGPSIGGGGGISRNTASDREREIEALLATLERYEELSLTPFERELNRIHSDFERIIADAQRLGVDMNRVTAAYQTALQSAWDDLVAPLEDIREQLTGGSLAGLTPEQALAEAEGNFQDLLARIAAGDTGAIANLPEVLNALLSTGSSFYGSSGGMADLRAQALAAIEAILGADGASILSGTGSISFGGAGGGLASPGGGLSGNDTASEVIRYQSAQVDEIRALRAEQARGAASIVAAIQSQPMPSNAAEVSRLDRLVSGVSALETRMRQSEERTARLMSQIGLSNDTRRIA